ncbi:hypothetical protein Pmani_026436 [Petrolisthes manimaculis]|uniref:Uncharacterized protein n=1 Tax=Petrolisthes manimaculis TaxID=1843537 RepID=A0AAE1P616_9EUCA|nr:hypothetical protein Pmani_026436 [Petrolisthes manimaculis]
MFKGRDDNTEKGMMEEEEGVCLLEVGRIVKERENGCWNEKSNGEGGGEENVEVGEGEVKQEVEGCFGGLVKKVGEQEEKGGGRGEGEGGE